jgi:hypothetical protein
MMGLGYYLQHSKEPISFSTFTFANFTGTLKSPRFGLQSITQRVGGMIPGNGVIKNMRKSMAAVGSSQIAKTAGKAFTEVQKKLSGLLGSKKSEQRASEKNSEERAEWENTGKRGEIEAQRGSGFGFFAKAWEYLKSLVKTSNTPPTAIQATKPKKAPDCGELDNPEDCGTDSGAINDREFASSDDRKKEGEKAD